MVIFHSYVSLPEGNLYGTMGFLGLQTTGLTTLNRCNMEQKDEEHRVTVVEHQEIIWFVFIGHPYWRRQKPYGPTKIRTLHTFQCGNGWIPLPIPSRSSWDRLGFAQLNFWNFTGNKEPGTWKFYTSNPFLNTFESFEFSLGPISPQLNSSFCLVLSAEPSTIHLGVACWVSGQSSGCQRCKQVKISSKPDWCQMYPDIIDIQMS